MRQAFARLRRRPGTEASWKVQVAYLEDHGTE